MKHYWCIRLEWKGNPRRWKWYKHASGDPVVFATRERTREYNELLRRLDEHPNHAARVVKVRIETV